MSKQDDYRDFDQRWRRALPAAYQQGSIENAQITAASHFLMERHGLQPGDQGFEDGLVAILNLDPDGAQAKPDRVGRSVSLSPEERDAAKIAGISERDYAVQKLKAQDAGVLPKK
jgi:phage I-like protein